MAAFCPSLQDRECTTALDGEYAVSQTPLTPHRLGPIRTHHSLTTQTIQFSADGRTAYAMTFFIGCHFGQGPHEGKVLQAYGKYVDELVLLEVDGDGDGEGDFEGVRGASGVWRIKKRTVGFTKRVGDEAIMREF